MTSGSSGAIVNTPQVSMQSGQHSMGPPSGAPQHSNANSTPSTQTSDQQQLMSPANGGQPVPMGQPMAAGTFPLLNQIGTHNQPQYQYVVINQQGQQVLQPANLAFPGMAAVPAQTAHQPGQQYILTTALPQQAKQGGQQPQMLGGNPVPAASQNATKSISQAPTYTLTSNGIVSQTGGPQSQTFMIAHQMNGSPTLQTAPNIVPSTSMPSHIKAEPGKPMQTAQQPQTVGTQQPMILPPGMAYVNTGQTAAPSQAYIQNGQIIFRAPAPQDGQATPQVMFSPQSIPMQTQTIQTGLPSQQLPPGLTTSMQPMTSMATTGTSNVVRAPVGYPSQAPAGKTQISRAPPTLLPATSTSTVTTSRTSTTTPFMTQPSPKSKQKMSPKTTAGNPLTKGLSTVQQATNKILNSVRNQASGGGGASVSPPVLTSNASPLPMPPGSPSAGGPPILQQSVAAPPPISTNHSQPPLLHPMMMPTSAASTINGKAVSLTSTPVSGGFKSIDTSGKVPIMPSIKKSIAPAAPMEPIHKNHDQASNGVKPPQECLTHVIDGHVIHESSQPFPLQEELKNGRPSKKAESKAIHPPVQPPTSSEASLVSRPLTNINNTVSLPPPPKIETTEKKRGPGRPPGSTKQNIEQQRLLQQQQHNLPNLPTSDIVKVNKDGSPATKKAKVDFEQGPPTLSSSVAPPRPLQQPPPAPNHTSTPPAPVSTKSPASVPAVSEVKSKYNIDVVTNNPLKWTVTQVCDFVKNLPGCSDYVEDFQLQEIDGQALMLLKADHLMSAMAIKLGPALKICNAIEAMREELKQNCRRAHRKRVLFKLGAKLVGEVDVVEERNNNESKNNGESSADSSSDSILSRASVYDEIFSDEEEPV